VLYSFAGSLAAERLTTTKRDLSRNIKRGEYSRLTANFYVDGVDLGCSLLSKAILLSVKGRKTGLVLALITLVLYKKVPSVTK
jgi:hypothetical protein|tara:strand:+ start:1119 stop:1367 length:249 start_codon:yes stop_codon:yes gene_type:complete